MSGPKTQALSTHTVYREATEFARDHKANEGEGQGGNVAYLHCHPPREFTPLTEVAVVWNDSTLQVYSDPKTPAK